MAVDGPLKGQNLCSVQTVDTTIVREGRERHVDVTLDERAQSHLSGENEG